MKEKKEYKMVQMDKDLHQALKSYCQHHGFNMAGFVAALVRQALRDNKKKQYEEDLYNQSRKHPGWSD